MTRAIVTGPSRLATARATFTNAIVCTAAKDTVDTIAREIVTSTIFAGYDFFGVVTLFAFAYAANALATAATIDEGYIIWATATIAIGYIVNLQTVLEKKK